MLPCAVVLEVVVASVVLLDRGIGKREEQDKKGSPGTGRRWCGKGGNGSSAESILGMLEPEEAILRIVGGRLADPGEESVSNGALAAFVVVGAVVEVGA